MSTIPAFERLVSVASPRGLDLIQLAGESINDYPLNAVRRRRFMARCATLRIEDKEARQRAQDELRFGETVSGKQTRVARASNALKLGEGLQGLKGPPYLAARFSFLMDESAHQGLHWELLAVAAEFGVKESWAVLLRADRRPWCEQLCELVLNEDWLKPLFTRSQNEHQVNLYAVAMGVSEEVWRASLMPRFLGLRLRYESWLRRARRHVEKQIFEEFHRLDIDSFATAS